MNPFGGEKKGGDDSMEEIFNQEAIDITAPGGESVLQDLGIKVKRRNKSS